MRKKLILTMVVLLTLVVACSKEEKSYELTKPPKNEVEEVKEWKEFPYSGIETEEDVNNRAIAVMVNNHQEARPQSGLSKADIVFEMLAEGNVTRFLAIFQSDLPNVVGPVRSAREYYFTLATGYDAIYIYHGAADFIDNMIKSRNIDHLNGSLYDNDGNLFVRETFRVAPHNSYLQFNAVYDVAEDKGYDTQFHHESLLFIEEGESIDGEDANVVKIDYYNNGPYVEYKYDETNKKYTRYNDGEKTVELESEIPIQLDNVFIIEADHQVIDEQSRRAIDLESGGRAYLLQRGKVQYIEWENRNGRILPVKDGQVVPFVPGKTWVNVVQTVPPSGVTEQVQISDNKE